MDNTFLNKNMNKIHPAEGGSELPGTRLVAVVQAGRPQRGGHDGKSEKWWVYARQMEHDINKSIDRLTKSY